MVTKLYHYTRTGALASIATNRELWLTDYRFLNDTQEYHLARLVAQNTITRFEFRSFVDSLPFRAELQPISTHVEIFREYLVGNLVSQSFSTPYRTRPYIFSLSTHGDSLSQWRAYGNGEVCIEFDAAGLQAAVNSLLVPVRYMSEQDIDPEFANEIANYVRLKLQKAAQFGRFEAEVTRAGAYDFVPYVRDRFRPAAIKHDGFREESEWRLIKEINFGLYEGTFFDGGRYPIPRLKLPFRADIPISEIITGVRFGPGSDRELASSFLETFNDSLRTTYSSAFSRIPYRG